MQYYPDIIERFTEGDCHILARALYKLTKWPLCSFVHEGENPHGDACEPLYLKYGYSMDTHVFNFNPDRRTFIDIEGESSKRSMAKRYGLSARNIKIGIPWYYVAQDWGKPGFGTYSYKLARREAARLAKEFA